MTGQHKTGEDAPPPCECCKYSMTCTILEAAFRFVNTSTRGRQSVRRSSTRVRENSEQLMVNHYVIACYVF